VVSQGYSRLELLLIREVVVCRIVAVLVLSVEMWPVLPPSPVDCKLARPLSSPFPLLPKSLEDKD
jgi:hypothetical protein